MWRHRVIVLVGFVVAATSVSIASDFPNCTLCGESFCLEMKPEYHVMASRPRNSGMFYHIHGPDFIIVLHEKNASHAAVTLADVMSSEIAGKGEALPYGLNVMGASGATDVACRAAAPDRCNELINNIRFYGFGCSEKSDCGFALDEN